MSLVAFVRRAALLLILLSSSSFSFAADWFYVNSDTARAACMSAYPGISSAYPASCSSAAGTTDGQCIPGSWYASQWFGFTLGVGATDRFLACNSGCPSGWSQNAGACVPPGGPVVPYADKNLSCPASGCEDVVSALVGNPINTATGNKQASETDELGKFVITRYYNSQFTYDIGFGFGWTNSLSTRKLYIAGYMVQLLRAQGKGEIFHCSTTPCQNNADTHLTLSKDATGYTLVVNATGATERYDLTGKLLSEIDRTGSTTSYSYNAANRVSVITGPFGHTLTLGYDASNHLTSVTNTSGETIGFIYDGTNNLVRVNYPDGTAKLYHYEQASFIHNLTGMSHQDAGGVATRFSTYGYNSAGKATSSEHAGGIQRVTLAYTSATQTTVTDAANVSEVVTFQTNLGLRSLTQRQNVSDGKTLTQTFDARNNVTCKKDEEGRVTTYTYNATNQKTSITEGRTGTCAAPVTTSTTRTTTYTYKSASLDLPTQVRSPSVYAAQFNTTTIAYTDSTRPNLPTTITQSGYTPAGSTVSRAIAFTYNSQGKLASFNGPRTDVNDVTTFTYNTCTSGNGCGQLSTVVNALGQLTTFDTYDGNARLLQMTAPNGLRTNYLYDPRGRVTQITLTPITGSARITQYTYTAAGDLASVSFPDATTLTYTYNAARKLTRVTDNQGNYVSYGYDLKGNPTSEYTYDPTNTLVRKIDLTYDIRNRVNQINNAGAITQQINDAVGNVTQVTDPKSNPATQQGFDALNRLTQTINSLGGTTSFTYDSNDKLKQVTAPNNATTQYGIDDLGNVLSEVSPDRGSTTYTYDSAGNLKTRTDARGIIATYSYDALNRPTSIDYPGTAEDVSYGYDSCINGIGRTCQITDGSGTTQYGYDAFGNITQQQKTELGIIYTTGFTYNAVDRISSITYPDGRVITYSRDTLGRISGVTATVNGSAQTIVSNRTYRADHLLTGQSYGNGINETKQYDLKGQLTNQAIGSVDTRVYTYDLNGNVSGIQSVPQIGSYQYDALDRLIMDGITSTPTSSVSFTYDANGNRISDGTSISTYVSNSNKLTSVGGTAFTMDAAGNITNDGTRTYTYNHIGQLQNVSQGGTTLGAYVYDHERRRTRKTTTTTTVFHYDLTDNLILEASATGNSQVAYIYADDTLIAQIARSGGIDTLTYLHTDHEGAPRLGTSPTASTTWQWNGRAFGNTAPNGTATINRRYGNSYYDAESGWWQMHHRYYSPVLGSFPTSDPIGLAGGENTFNYALNNPLTYIDPNGLNPYEQLKIQQSIRGVSGSLGAGGNAARYGGAGMAAEFAKKAPIRFESSTAGAISTTTSAMACEISTPQGVAVQSASAQALAALQQIRGGAGVYRAGQFGVQETVGAQYWSLQNPVITPNYVGKMGIPGAPRIDWVMGGSVRPNAPVVTRSAPAAGKNGGGSLEAVTEQDGVRYRWFHMP